VRPVRYGHSSRWGLRIVRHLNRLPARGGYLDPRTACRTLLQYIRLMQHRGNAVCSCPIQIVPPGMAAGILRGHRVSVAVDACAACGAGPPAGHDVGVLLVG
jgi:hypothetical protein